MPKHKTGRVTRNGGYGGSIDPIRDTQVLTPIAKPGESFPAYRQKGIVFFSRHEDFGGNFEEGGCNVGTMFADPRRIKIDLVPLPFAQGNLRIYNRKGDGGRGELILPDGSVITDSKKIREACLPFHIAAQISLYNNPLYVPVTVADFANVFANLHHTAFKGGRLFYPTGMDGDKEHKEDFSQSFFSLVQMPEGGLDFFRVIYEIEKTKRINDLFDEVSARAFRAVKGPQGGKWVKGEELDPNIQAISAIPIMEGGVEADMGELIRTGMIQDLRHRFHPALAKHEDFPEVSEGVFGGIFFGITELAENGYEKAAAACNGPVTLRSELVVSPGRKIQVSEERATELLEKYEYRKKKGEGDLKPGEFRFVDDSHMEIYLLPNPYPMMLIGRTKKDNLFIESIGGRSGYRGITLSKLPEYARRMHLKDLILFSQGNGSLLGYVPTLPHNVRDQIDEMGAKFQELIVEPSSGYQRDRTSCAVNILYYPRELTETA